MKRKKNFSFFTQKEAFELLGIEDLILWDIGVPPATPGDFFHERLKRLEVFDLTGSESSKELLIEAVFEEAILKYPMLKIWKSVPLKGNIASGIADYLIGKRRRYLNTPLLCVAEAKKDDFEKGMIQCLLEMNACRWNNQQENFVTDIFGIVSNGEIWKFYKTDTYGKYYESMPYSIKMTDELLGVLSHIFHECENYLKQQG